MTSQTDLADPAALTEDRFLGGRLTIRQPARGYRAAMDPVLLAAAVAVVPGEHVLDVGTGAGTAALCLARRVPEVRVLGLERDPHMVTLARANAAANALADRVDLVEGDLLATPLLPDAGRFDRVMANPPFLRAGAHTPPPFPGKSAATGESEAALEDWVAYCHRMVRPRGTVTLIHRADRLAELMALMHGRFGGIIVFPLWPRQGKPAKRVIVSGRRDMASPTRLLAGLTLHGHETRHTPEAEAVLRHGKGLSIVEVPGAKDIAD